jgi:acyl carrier protein
MNDAPFGRAEILETINRVAADILGASDLVLSEETTARDVGGWDSLSHVQILLGVESAFGIRLNATEIAQIENTGSLIDLIQRHVSLNGRGG